MKIALEDLGKKYNNQWVFRHLNETISAGEKWAITGHNGSGKSTLLKTISGIIAPSQGTVAYSDPTENDQLRFSIAAPYLSIIDEFTLEEHLDFHKMFKKPLLSNREMINESGLNGSGDKLVKDFSSGMKQRLRLSMAFFFESEAILLDEPTSNLDGDGSVWYQHLIASHTNNRTLLIASNAENEFHFCEKQIDVTAVKGK